MKDFLLVFFLIFGPVFDSPLGPFGDSAVLIAFCLVFSRVYSHKLIYATKPLLFALLLLLSLSVYSLTTYLLLDPYSAELSLQPILRPIKALILLLGCYVLAFHLLERGYHFRSLVWLVFLSVVFHAFIMGAQFLSPDFREFVYTFTEAKYVLEVYQATRMAGLSGAGGAQLSVVQGLGVLLASYLWVTESSKIKLVIVIGGGLLCLASVLLCGRSGLLVVALFAPAFLFLSFFVKSEGVSLGKITFSLVILILIVLVIIAATFQTITSDAGRYIFFRTFRTIVDYSETGNLQDNTLIALSQMFYFPSELAHLMFGKPSYLKLNTYYGINSDIGYIQLLWAYGVIGSCAHYLLYILAVASVLKLSNISSVTKVLVVLSILLILLFNAKEVFIFARMSFQITVLLFFGAVLFSRIDFDRAKRLY
ncbi:MAG: hypothetical protein C9356_12745 [Oleiphilus sp.]|nr:MAG: hypothetical protein C9356_12745 [Oleiphilus sp.]